MLLLAVFLSIFPPFSPSSFAHDYHVSKTNIRYSAEKEQVQVEMHVFVEDLEKDMALAGAPEGLEIGTKREAADADRYIMNYLRKNFRVQWNSVELPLEVVGYELSDDLHGLWIYLAAPVEDPPIEVIISNTLITGVYADQKNIVKLYNGEKRSATLLMSKDRPNAEHIF